MAAPVSVAGNYKIRLDYNGSGKVDTSNLYDVDVWKVYSLNGTKWGQFQEAADRAIPD